MIKTHTDCLLLTAEVKAAGFEFFSFKKDRRVKITSEQIPKSAVYLCRSYDCKKAIVQTAGVPYNVVPKMTPQTIIPGYDPAFMRMQAPVTDPSHFRLGFVPLPLTEVFWFESDKRVDPDDVVKKPRK